MVLCHVNEERREKKTKRERTLWKLFFADIVVFTFYTKLFLHDLMFIIITKANPPQRLNVMWLSLFLRRFVTGSFHCMIFTC